MYEHFLFFGYDKQLRVDLFDKKLINVMNEMKKIEN